jgi:phage baseplate assembly protein gpV
MKHFQEGLISSIRYVTLGNGKRCEVKVDTDDRVSPWLEVRTRVTKHYKEFTPPSIGDQAFIHNPNGIDNEDAYVEIGVAYESVPLPSDIDKNTIGVWISDGTTYIHDLKNKTIKIDTLCDFTLKAKKINLDSNVKVTGDLKVDGDINSDGKISDKLGDLTGHKHEVVQHSLAKPRS